jgi:hypothetical protein
MIIIHRGTTCTRMATVDMVATVDIESNPPVVCDCSDVPAVSCVARWVCIDSSNPRYLHSFIALGRLARFEAMILRFCTSDWIGQLQHLLHGTLPQHRCGAALSHGTVRHSATA